MKLLSMLFFVTFIACACGGPTNLVNKNNTPEVLTIYPDGTMEYRDRIMNEEEVIIYPDGRMEYRDRIMDEDEVIIYSDGKGGEKAAIRVWNPLQPPSRKDSKYYRDTIIVERIKPVTED